MNGERLAPVTPLEAAGEFAGTNELHRVGRRGARFPGNTPLVEDDAGRLQLAERFLESQKHMQIDPWAERAAGKEAAEFTALRGAAEPRLAVAEKA